MTTTASDHPTWTAEDHEHAARILTADRSYQALQDALRARRKAAMAAVSHAKRAWVYRTHAVPIAVTETDYEAVCLAAGLDYCTDLCGVHARIGDVDIRTTECGARLCPPCRDSHDRTCDLAECRHPGDDDWRDGA